GALGQVDLPPAVRGQRPSLPRPAAGRGQGPQVGILAQPAEHDHPQRPHRLQERPLGIGAIDRQPDGLAGVAQPPPQPADHLGGQRQLGAELPGVVLGQRRHVLGADVEQGAQRQGQGAPGGVVGQPGQRHPDVAVDEPLASRARGGVVVGAGALHAGAVARRGRVVDANQEVVAGGAAHQGQQGGGEQAVGEGPGAAGWGPEGGGGAGGGGGGGGGGG